MGLRPHGHGGLHLRDRSKPHAASPSPRPCLCPSEARAPGSSEKGLTLTAPSRESAWVGGGGVGTAQTPSAGEWKPQLLCPEVPGRALPSQPLSRCISHPEATEAPELIPQSSPTPSPVHWSAAPNTAPDRDGQASQAVLSSPQSWDGVGAPLPSRRPAHPNRVSQLLRGFRPLSAPPAGQRSVPFLVPSAFSTPPLPPFQMLPFHSDHFISKATNC